MAAAHVNINKINISKRVLVAPLDWGLGHATRCIPLIYELIFQNFEVMIAAEKAAAALLQKEFPALKILPLRGYRVAYSRNRSLFFFKMLVQFPKLLAAVKHEHRWLKQILKEEQIDIVISDNRFGLWNKNVKTVFITHQLFIKTGSRVTEFFAQKINYRFIKKFDECWVPDEKYEGLAGILSHPLKLPGTPVTYIGTLSRFEIHDTEKNIDLLIMLSGPEPQRSIFENLILKQVKNTDLKIVMLRGLPAGGEQIKIIPENLTVIGHLPAAELNILISASKIVLSRSGYSTVMELAALQQKAILIPTPGQSEQEYLAKYLSEKKYCIAETQADFNLISAIGKINKEDMLPFPAGEKGLLQNAVSSLR